jgi:RimJ/RimL family protein N-acetyltransferase
MRAGAELHQPMSAPGAGRDEKKAHFREAHVLTEPSGPWIDSVRYAVLASEWLVHPKR